MERFPRCIPALIPRAESGPFFRFFRAPEKADPVPRQGAAFDARQPFRRRAWSGEA
jgi:hypothetical protein